MDESDAEPGRTGLPADALAQSVFKLVDVDTGSPMPLPLHKVLHESAQ